MSDQTVSPSSKRSPLIRAFALVFVVILAVAAYWFSYGQYFESTDNAYTAGDVTNISAQISGKVIQSFVSENQKVSAGQLLGKIDDRDFLVSIEKAKANVTLASTELETLHAQQQLQQSKISQAKSKIASAQAQYNLAKQQVIRAKSLIKSNYASQKDLDTAISQQKVTQAQVKEAQAGLQAANDSLNVITSQLQQAKAKISVANAQLEQAKIALSYTKIKAPVDGVVGKKGLRVGLYVQPGMPLLSVVPSDKIWVTANFKETQIADIKPGMKVELALDAYPDTPLEGEVESFSPATGAQFALFPPENATGNFTKVVQRVPVRIKLLHPEKLQGRLIPGLSVEAMVDLRK
ncbi:HlyD family secretion protein [Parashewanella curva]|uniref:HlyD family secretion protein n=1 Tax=Parashewanella curva TaxID=2338552 RepID=A0A3L8Q3L3_9GAMM|nr:HlyD family secretion protein [Parashewanella curva]RLV61332.1 HlyD family secretion protein [Parashewanella curva]